MVLFRGEDIEMDKEIKMTIVFKPDFNMPKMPFSHSFAPQMPIFRPNLDYSKPMDVKIPETKINYDGRK